MLFDMKLMTKPVKHNYWGQRAKQIIKPDVFWQPQESPPAGHPALASVFRPRDYGHLLYSVCKEQSEKNV